MSTKSSNLPKSHWGIETTGPSVSEKIVAALKELGIKTTLSGNASVPAVYYIREEGEWLSCSASIGSRDGITVFTWEEFQKKINQPEIITEYAIY